MGYAEAIEQQRATHEVYAQLGPDVLPYDDNSNLFTYNPLMCALGRGDAFYVAPEIARMLDSAAASIPLYTLREEHLPASFGWISVGAPVAPLESDGHGTVWTTALAWAAIRDDEPPHRTGITLDVFIDHPGDPTSTHKVYSGGDTWWFGTEQWASTERDDGTFNFSAQRWFAAFLLFIQQSLLVTSTRVPGTRQQRREMMRKNEYIPTVKVVELRRREYQQRDESHDAHIEYSCQWLVRGHWRQQFFPSTGEHRPLWISPHVKGPSDKPLKAPTITAYEVVR